MFQVFGTSPGNRDAEVAWEFGALVGSGWASMDDFRPGARRRQTFLIAPKERLTRGYCGTDWTCWNPTSPIFSAS
ncbi:HEPN/Toprim-associated domain-containing protein [Mesorhizobium sp. L-2-11]|uniref:HEPN/Toprim-associated domain-containing protein n=1 Tax=Mesorhizobium sp. L-2-11 TaxID=2744521 RepID=UPI001FD54476|nr:HEPN/Toprim-associated domain-containing protein [Mesorhizobium sp. L-2-11]